MHRTPSKDLDYHGASQELCAVADADSAGGNQSSGGNQRLRQQSLEWLADYGDLLYGYALRRVMSPDLAEELVQETFLGAIRNQHSYSGDSTPRTWLVSILRNKIVDHYRQKTRIPSLASHPPAIRIQDRQSRDPSEYGPARWGAEKPAEQKAKPWSDPTSSLSEAEFQGVLRECVSELPDLVRQAFEYRFFDHMELDEVCELQEISPNNLAARMYRARKFLLKCLHHRWF